MSSMTRLRMQICAVCCVLGGATAFLAFTHRGMLVLAIALGVAAILAILLWFSRPDVFRGAASKRPINERARPALKRIMTADTAGSARTLGTTTERPLDRR